MSLLIIAGFFALCGWLTSTASGQVGDTTAKAVAPGAAAQQTNSLPNGPGESQDNSWRYVNHNHQWWYYLPSKQWVVWNGGRWVTPAEMARPTVVDQPRFHAGYRGNQMYYPYQPQSVPDPYLGRPIYRRFFPNMPFVPFPEDPTTSQPVTGPARGKLPRPYRNVACSSRILVENSGSSR